MSGSLPSSLPPATPTPGVPPRGPHGMSCILPREPRPGIWECHSDLACPSGEPIPGAHAPDEGPFPALGTQGLGGQPPCQSQPWTVPAAVPVLTLPGPQAPLCWCPSVPAPHALLTSLLSASPWPLLPPPAAGHPSPSSQQAASTSTGSASRVPHMVWFLLRVGPGPAPQGWEHRAATRPVSRAD